MSIPRNTAASMYNAWFRKEYPELFGCEIKETVESCDECGFCEVKEVLGNIYDNPDLMGGSGDGS